MAQYPLVKRISRRVARNSLLDGGIIKAADPDAYRVSWELRYRGLTDAERVSLEDFFQSVQGRLRSFVYLDPAGNLLRWSVDLTKEPWRLDPMMQVNGSRLVNAGQVGQGLEQIVAAPGTMQYAWSASVRADDPAQIMLSMGACSTTMEAASRWQRVVCTGIPGSEEDVRCRVELAPGAVVDIRDLQLEAQRFPSGYRPTAQSSGVYAGTRFDQDRLVFTAHGIDDHAVNIRLVSKAGV